MTVYWKDQAPLYLEALTWHLTRNILVSGICPFLTSWKSTQIWPNEEILKNVSMVSRDLLHAGSFQRHHLF